MALYLAEGSATKVLEEEYLRQSLHKVFGQLGKRTRVLAIPPDFTRVHSRAGELTCITDDYYGRSLVDILPALGTHAPMSEDQLSIMYTGIPKKKFREHRRRKDLKT